MYGFSDTKEDDDYWLDAVRDFWAETGLDIDEIELRWIIEWFDRRRGLEKDNTPDDFQNLS